MTHWEGDDHVRRAHAFRIVAYQTPRGTAAAYYRDNPLVPLDSTALGSNTPTSKSVIIRLQRPGTGGSTHAAGGQQPLRADDHHKSDPEPLHLS